MKKVFQPLPLVKVNYFPAFPANFSKKPKFQLFQLFMKLLQPVGHPANLSKVSIRNLAHAGNWTLVAEFASHIDSHYTTDPQEHIYVWFTQAK